MSAIEPVLTEAQEDSVELFAEQLVTMLNHGAIVAMISLGHKLKLFDHLAERSPASSEKLAEEAGLNERYVREWLATMTTGKIIHYDPDSRSYSLPPAHAACLTRAAVPNNIAVNAQFVPLIAKMEDALIQCFKNGGGLPYQAYPCFHQVMSEDSAQTVVSALRDHILPLIPGLNARLEQGIDVLDAGCGAGLALLSLARAYPRSRFVGYDLCPEAFAQTAREAACTGLTNLTFEARDLRNFSEPERFDLITSFDAVHDQADPQALLSGIAKSLKPGGTYLMQDISGSSYLENNLEHPLGPLLYSISCVHCTPVSLAQGGPGLGTMWGEELATDMLQKAGFESIACHRLDHDPFNVYFVAQPGDQ
ncbi:methyltransferase domain-containing protein [Marinobacter panjinensis]|uniref:Methyltransferase domain-containing protein n=1 Tax=Marinobacter panjinensis TaxID=2576384 RepID=A0A4U6QZB9_9GAMM|nr:class I SAM-dependent methyltransferase [Marinobacter panjinensis]MCR8915420.1 methyltransferase domain-containing protein [Marinobacter panjinensis]TKV66677.1 methyltransferase domain-containing protein [Marinobacter panjinensis]